MNYMKVISKGEKGWRGGVKEGVEPDFGGFLKRWVGEFCGDESAVKECFSYFYISLLFGRG